MLGVTVFGVLLTPVFYEVIDRLGDSAAFRLAPVRLLSAVGLELVSLRLTRRLTARALRRAMPPSPERSLHPPDENETPGPADSGEEIAAVVHSARGKSTSA
jgi:hypothetical protein